MRIPYFFFFSFLVTASFITNGQTWDWARSADVPTPGGSEGYACATDDLGNIYGAGYCFSTFRVGGNTFTNFGGGSAAYIVKYDSIGTFLWANTTHYGKAFALGITVDPYNNVYLFGGYDSSFQFGTYTVTSTHTPRQGYFIAKISPSGTVLWAKGIESIVSSFYMQTTSIKCDISGNIYVTCPFVFNATLGSFSLINSDPTGSQSDILVAKFDSSGNVLWAKRYGGDGSDNPAGISITPSNNIYLGGNFNGDSLVLGSTTLIDTVTGSIHGNMFVAKLDNSGNPIWAKKSTGSGPAITIGLASNNAEEVFMSVYYGGTVTLGSYTAPIPPTPSGYGLIVKYDASGIVSWLKTIRGNYVVPHGVAIDACGHVWLHGVFGTGHVSSNDTIDGYILAPPPINGDPTFIAGWNTTGTFIAASVIASGSTDDINGITSDKCGNIYVIADQEDCDTMTIGGNTFINTGEDMFIAKYRPNIGCNCQNASQNDVTQNSSIDIFPNPATNECKVSYKDILFEKGTITVCDIAGKLLHTYTLTGNTTTICVADLPPGLYLCSIYDNEQLVTNKKLVVMK